MANNITRSTVNSEQYAAPEFQKSGFDLSYNLHSSWLLGRLHVLGYQYCMPGDKISGKSETNGTFNRIVTPMISPVRGMNYQIFMPFRGVDRTFKKGMTPTKLNNMSASWSVPTCNTRDLFDKIVNAYVGDPDDTTNDPGQAFLKMMTLGTYDAAQGKTLNQFLTDASLSLNDFLYTNQKGIVTTALQSLTFNTGTLYQMAESMYLVDALKDIADQIRFKLGDITNPLSGSLPMSQVIYLILDCLITPFLGRYSYYKELGYAYLRPKDLLSLSADSRSISTWTQVLARLDNTPRSEYALRIMYTIWYERFRNVDLEPVSSSLPDWNDFGSTSIFDLGAGGNLLYLIYRIRSWEKDMFTSAQIDDLSRHVYAPVFSNSVDGYVHNNKENNLDTQLRNTASDDGAPKPAGYDLKWIDQLTGTSKNLFCPVPTNINDIISSTDLDTSDIYGLDLNSLRQSQMLERYLKRNYLFGDEYQDRLLAHYNSRLSDMRINRPEIVGQAIGDYDMGQEVSNVSTSAGTNVGDRTATATIKITGDQYTTFCEEFGLLINVGSFMPVPSYDGDCPQLLLTKQVDFPLPEFAANNEEFGRKLEIAGTGLAHDFSGTDDTNPEFIFGRYPAYHAWRSRVDEVGGMFLDELQNATFRRFWGLNSAGSTPKLNYEFIHCRPNLGMFADTIRYNSQIYGDCVQECYVERVLPTPVETI